MTHAHQSTGAAGAPGRGGTPLDLATAPRGSRMQVIGLAPGDPLIRRRLFDLGFRAGVEVTPVRAAPLGDPRIYRLHGADFSLRRTEAALILVEAVASEGADAGDVGQAAHRAVGR